jgi:hypothetical protein
MRFGKVKMFLLLNGLIASMLFLYFTPWLFSVPTNGKIVSPYESTTIHVQYLANGKTYSDSYMRNGIQFSQRSISIRYLSFHPQTSSVNSFMGLWAEPLAWWSVFLLATAMLLLTDNSVFSKGTIFQLQKKFPWISMEEYFPFENEAYYQWRGTYSNENEWSKENKKKKDQTPLLNDGDKQV